MAKSQSSRMGKWPRGLMIAIATDQTTTRKASSARSFGDGIGPQLTIDFADDSRRPPRRDLDLPARLRDVRVFPRRRRVEPEFTARPYPRHRRAAYIRNQCVRGEYRRPLVRQRSRVFEQVAGALLDRGRAVRSDGCF